MFKPTAAASIASALPKEAARRHHVSKIKDIMDQSQKLY